ncbi:MAG: transposase [Planctomycetes bacterium]|nr:transposase [Planctomycetota bacterium]
MLSLPHGVRFLLARHPDLCREVRGIFARAIHSFYIRRAKAAGRPDGRCGSVIQVQRFDSAIRLDVHFHGLFLDGVYTGVGALRQPLTFHAARHLEDGDVRWMVRHIRSLVFGHLHRRGFLDEHAALSDESGDDLDEMATHHAAAVQGLIPFGRRSGQTVLLFGDAVPDRRP